MTGRARAKTGPNRAQVSGTDSSPVCGVEIAKAADAPRPAPDRRSPAATGMTAHEQRGSGMPSRLALRIGTNLDPPCALARCLARKPAGMNAWTTPVSASPAMSQTPVSSMICQKAESVSAANRSMTEA